MRWLDGVIDSIDMSLSKLGDSEGEPDVLQSMGTQRVGLKELKLNQTHKIKDSRREVSSDTMIT